MITTGRNRNRKVGVLKTMSDTISKNAVGPPERLSPAPERQNRRISYSARASKLTFPLSTKKEITEEETEAVLRHDGYSHGKITQLFVTGKVYSLDRVPLMDDPKSARVAKNVNQYSRACACAAAVADQNGWRQRCFLPDGPSTIVEQMQYMQMFLPF